MKTKLNHSSFFKFSAPNFPFFLAVCFVFIAKTAISQKEANIWYFGNKAGLDFNTNPPTALTNGSMNSIEACASISDASGNLLFYTDGVTVWNKNHLVMANGTGLDGHQSTTQGALILKQPGSSNIYFIFTIYPQFSIQGFKYSKVDMLLASGNGSVTQKNIAIIPSVSEKMAAVKHCNGKDYWIIVHDSTNVYRAFEFTASGINPVSVNSSVGSYFGYGFAGCIKFSPDCRKLAAATSAVDSVGGYKSGVFELFDFDNSTGIISNPTILAKGFSGYLYAYGVEFSNDSKVLYGARANTPPENKIFQWNLCAGSKQAVASSLFVVATPTTNEYSMQRAANGKIYVSRYNTGFLSVVNQPGLLGANCSYSSGLQQLASKVSYIGLPQFPSNFERPLPVISTSVSCLKSTFTSSIQSFGGCSANSNSVTNIEWKFGDPASGASNLSNAISPSHDFSAEGSYTVQLVTNYNCGSDTIKKIVTITKCTALAEEGRLHLNSVSPNPSEGQVHLDLCEDFKLTIFDYAGSIINNSVYPSGEHLVTIEKPGVYIFQFSNRQRCLTQRIIITGK